MNFLDKHRLLIISVLFFGLTIPLALILNIRPDEAYSLNTTSGGLIYAFKQAIYFEMQAPVYFTILAAWRLISGSIFWARFFSILSIFFSIFLIDRLLEGRIKYRFLPLLFLAFHPISIWAALEIRIYAFSILTVSTYLFFFIKYYERKPEKKLFRFLNIVLILIGLSSYYYFGFILAGIFLYLFIINRKLIFNYILDLIIPALLLPPMLQIIIQQIDGHSHIGEPVLFSLPNLINYWMVDFYDLFFVPIFFIGPNKAFNIFVRFFFPAIIFFVLIKNKHILLYFFKSPFFWVSLMLVVFFSMVKFILGPVYASHPHASLSLIPIFLTIVKIICLSKQQHLINTFFVGLFLISSLSHLTVYQKLYKEHDVKALANYLHTLPVEQPAFIYTNESYEILSYYLKDERKFYPLPKKIAFKKFNLNDWVITDHETLKTIVQKSVNDFDQDLFIYISDNKVFIEDCEIDHQKLVRDFFLEYFILIDSLQIGGFSVFMLSKESFMQAPQEH